MYIERMKQETDTTTTGPSPLVAEESDDIILSVDDDEPAAAEIKEDHDHEAEIFAGFSLESNGIRFRGPKSGKTVRGGLLFVFLLCAHDVSAFSYVVSSQHFSPVVFEDRYNTQLILEETDEKSNAKTPATDQL